MVQLSQTLVQLQRDVRFPGLDVPLEAFRWSAPDTTEMPLALRQLEALRMTRCRDRWVESWMRLGVDLPEGVAVSVHQESSTTNYNY